MAKKNIFDYDLIVIGSGAAGSVAATITARSGKKVAVIEENIFGGDSPNIGDVPLAALAQTAKLYSDSRDANRFGLRTNTVGYNLPAIRAWKELVVKRTGAGGNQKYYEANGVTPIQGRAHFISPHEISVNRRHLSAAKFLIATGTNLAPSSIQGIDEIDYLTIESLTTNLKLAKQVLVVGGGERGVMAAQLLATFGTKVHLAEISTRLLPRFDQSIGESLERTLTDRQGVNVLTQSRIVAVSQVGATRRITYSRGGTEHTLRVDEILLATERTPATDLGLENALVDYNENGIITNEHLQTSVKHIFAAGDVLGETSNTHTALLESRTVARNLYTRSPQIPDYRATPQIILTNPEIAQVGLSEDDCLRRDLDIISATAPLSMVARSNASDFHSGFVKLIANRKTGILVGAAIVAPSAAEMIHELALAIRHNLTVGQVADTPHAFLSWSEAIRIAAGKLS